MSANSTSGVYPINDTGVNTWLVRPVPDTDYTLTPAGSWRIVSAPTRKRLPALLVGALALAVGLAAYSGVHYLVRRDS